MSRARNQVPQAALALLIALCVVALAAVPANAAPKAGVATIGGPAAGATGGLFNGPRGVAINQSGAGGVGAGTIYVADSTNNRIQRFNADGSFDSAWGQDVDSTAVGTGYEVCTALSGNVCKAGITTAQTGGAMNQPQAVAVDQSDGSVYVIDQGNRRVQKFTSTGVFVWAAGWDVVSTGLGDDATGTINQFETCVAANGDVCKIAAVAGANAGQFAGAATGIAVNQSNGQVVVADGTNMRVQKLTSAGAFVSAVGYDVIPTGQTGNLGTQLEVCPAGAAQVTGGCQAGQTTNGGANPGQFSAGQPSSVATDSGGSVYAVEATGNNRVQKLTASGSGATIFAPALVSGSPAPTNVAVDQSNDRLYIVKGTSGVLEFDGAGAYVETHAGNASLPAATGIDVRSPGGNLYYPTLTNNRIIVLGTATVAPTATQDPVTVFTPTTGTFSGTVNPTGMATGYHFDYRRDQDPTFTKLPAADADAGGGSSPVVASQNATGLSPNTLYHVRLVATKAYGGGTATTPEVTFTTSGTPPTVTLPVPDEVSDTTAKLTARIDPNNQPTNYRFEYGTADCASNPCTNTPIPDATLAADAGNTYVSQTIEGLTPNTTYHYRVVATNTTATTNSPDRTFTTATSPVSAPPAPDGYELVSPPGSQDYSVRQASGTGNSAAGAKGVTTDGRCATYALTANGTLPGMALDGGAADSILACRTAIGWTSTAPAGDRTTCSYNGTTDSSGNNSEVIHDIADDGSRTIFAAGACTQTRMLLSGGLDQIPCCPTPQIQSLFDNETEGDIVSYLSGAFDVNGPIPRADSAGTNYLGGSPDLQTIYFATGAALLPGMSAVPSGMTYLYRRNSGVTTLVSKTPGGVPVAVPSGGAASNADSVIVQTPGAVSVDGSALTFTTAGVMDTGDTNGAVQDVYQVRGAQVVWASKTAFTGPVQTAAGKVFEGASSDGHRIFFSSTEKLVGNGTSTGDLDTVRDLYVYDEDAPSGQEVSRVSVADPGCGGACNDNLSNGTAANTSTAKFVALSSDGSHVFFISGDVLSATDVESPAQQSLYVRDLGAGTTTYIAPVGVGATNDNTGTDAGLTTNGSLASGLRYLRQIVASPDGTVAAFQLTTNVTLPDGRGGSDTDGLRDTFVWGEDSGLRRVRQGLGPDDNTSTVPVLGCGFNVTNGHCATMTSDGALVYLSTTDRLVAGDTDNGVTGTAQCGVSVGCDVYAVDPRSGRILQISPAGSDPSPALYLFNSASGSDVFFRTAEAIDPSRDTDPQAIDVYDARTGVDVFDLLPPVGACVGDGCQGPVTPGPGGSQSPSVSAEDRNASAGNRDVVSGVRVSAAGRSGLAKGRRARLRLRVSGAGTVALVATARIRGKARRVASATTRAEKAGTVSIPFGLSKAARRELRRKGRLSVSLAVRYGNARQRVVSVVLKAPKPRPAKRSTRKGR